MELVRKMINLLNLINDQINNSISELYAGGGYLALVLAWFLWLLIVLGLVSVTAFDLVLLFGLA